MQGLPSYVLDGGPNAEQLEKSFGTFLGGIWSLLASITGGVDWLDVAEPLSDLGPQYRVLFALYICSVLFGLLNIVSGICLNVALKAGDMARDMAMDMVLSDQKQLAFRITDIFLEADLDQSGALTFDEFKTHLQDEKVKALFMDLDIDISCAERVFVLLDPDKCGEVQLEEFVDGVLKHRGSAKMVDLALLSNAVQDTVVGQQQIIMKALEKLQETTEENRDNRMPSDGVRTMPFG